ncbi:MAG: FxsA family protein, partial [Pseudomonadota bacterium]
LLELMVFASVGEEIGLLNTLLLALITAIIGGAIVKHQGMQTIVNMRGAMGQGKMPLSDMFDGFCLVVAGATLITPGFITDTVGFVLLVPQMRAVLKNIIMKHTSWSVSTHSHSYNNTTMQDPDIIEGEYEPVDETKDQP